MENPYGLAALIKHGDAVAVSDKQERRRKAAGAATGYRDAQTRHSCLKFPLDEPVR